MFNNKKYIINGSKSMRSLFRNITEEMERKCKCLDNREEKAKTKTKRNSKSGINTEDSIAFPWVMGRHIGLSAHNDVVIRKEEDG